MKVRKCTEENNQNALLNVNFQTLRDAVSENKNSLHVVNKVYY